MIVAAKLTKAEVEYGPGMGNTRCRFCDHFRRPSACELVQGTIRAEDWCNKFERKM